jgi:hypothetical protein
MSLSEVSDNAKFTLLATEQNKYFIWTDTDYNIKYNVISCEQSKQNQIKLI